MLIFWRLRTKRRPRTRQASSEFPSLSRQGVNDLPERIEVGNVTERTEWREEWVGE
jgi:hypothetical protein